MEDRADAAQVYRKLAAEMREKAAHMKDYHAIAVMLSAADNYERLANVIEKPPVPGIFENS